MKILGMLGLLLWPPTLLAAEKEVPIVRAIPNGCHGVALTFDLCPVLEGPGFDAELIEALRSRWVPATFFLSGAWIETHDRETRQLLETPFFELGTHGQEHRHLPNLKRRELRLEIQAPVQTLLQCYGAAPFLFRPPYGLYDERSLLWTRRLGLDFVLWSDVSGDPDPHLSAKRILAELERTVRSGSVVIFHANGHGRHTREVVEELLDRFLPSKGLEPMTVSDLLGCAAARSAARQ